MTWRRTIAAVSAGATLGVVSAAITYRNELRRDYPHPVPRRRR